MHQVAVVGAAGRMGSWFTSYFACHGFNVWVYDINQKPSRAVHNIKIKESLRECVKDADLVIVSVPQEKTVQSIRECSKNMKQGSIIAEISSIKNKTFAALKKVPMNLRPLCIHPMFGPGASQDVRVKVLLVPVRNEKKELKIANEIFENAAITVLSNPRHHDRLIAIVLGLTYFTNIVFAKVISSGNISVLKQVSGTTFGLQSLITESILTDEPELISALIKGNMYTRKYIDQYLKEATSIARLSLGKDNENLKAEVQKTKAKMQRWQNLQESYKRLYDIAENIR
jgi:prephenate dehydrogenase